MNIWIIGDLHFGHKNICKYRSQFSSPEEHEEHIIENWNDTIKKDSDHVYCLGDAAFTFEGLAKFKRMRGQKYLIRGNHDTLPTNAYLTFFKAVYGLHEYKHCWLSHAPIHPQELRGRINLHGHVHHNTIMDLSGQDPDPRYINTCPENIGYAPVPFRSLVPPRKKNAGDS